jgi:hypothetical protein
VRKRAAIGNDTASIADTGLGNLASQRRIDSSVTRTMDWDAILDMRAACALSVVARPQYEDRGPLAQNAEGFHDVRSRRG